LSRWIPFFSSPARENPAWRRQGSEKTVSDEGLDLRAQSEGDVHVGSKMGLRVVMKGLEYPGYAGAVGLSGIRV